MDKTPISRPKFSTVQGTIPRPKDKLNQVDFHWFVVRSLPHQEKKLAGLLQSYMRDTENILEVYCPTRTTVSTGKNGNDAGSPLFAGYVFVLSTQKAVVDFINRHYPEGAIMYESKKSDGRKPGFLTIPEEQMRFFKDFNENYADQVIVLERPYTDYAFNPKTNEPNEIVKIIEGPLKGREGYLVRFRRDKRLVFNMKSLSTDRHFAVSVPNAWSLKAVRLNNAENDRQNVATMKERATDMLIGIIESCGYGEQTLPLLYCITGYLAATPTLVGLCRDLRDKGHEKLNRLIGALGTKEAELILNLARYEHDNPGYVKANWERLVIRPFLTPASGTVIESGKDEAELEHPCFTEIIKKVSIAETVYYPSKEKEETETTDYFAHIGIMPGENGTGNILFANWDTFLGEYFLTAGKANEKLVEGGERNNGEKGKLIDSFRNFAPTLYNILTGGNPTVKAIQNMDIGKDALNVIAVETSSKDTEATAKAKNELITACVNICTEINSTVHLAVWRRYLRTVWLHK